MERGELVLEFSPASGGPPNLKSVRAAAAPRQQVLERMAVSWAALQRAIDFMLSEYKTSGLSGPLVVGAPEPNKESAADADGNPIRRGFVYNDEDGGFWSFNDPEYWDECDWLPPMRALMLSVAQDLFEAFDLKVNDDHDDDMFEIRERGPAA